MQLLEETAAKPGRLVVGLMTGTSADGIDAVLARIFGSGTATRFELLAHATSDIPPALREGLFDLFKPDATVDDLTGLNFELGETLAAAALEVIGKGGAAPEEVDLIGSHGQTVRHFPRDGTPSTLQIGEPAVIAQRTGITTVADFRPADVALGGQGAPLVPLVDLLLFGHPGRGRLMLNIGGIANVTVLPPGAGPDEVAAFDLGPGNMLVDGAVSFLTGGGERFDRDGRRAASGTVDQDWLGRLLEHEFLHRPPPKSTGREEFGAEYLFEVMTSSGLAGDALIATLTAFTAGAVVQGIGRFALAGGGMEELWVSGGGVHNRCLMDQIARGLPELRVAPTDEIGVPADAKEALAFAVLANETLAGNSGNLPAATGAERAAVLGKICPGRKG